MPALSFDLFWRDHGAQRGMRDLGRETQSTHGRFSALAGVAATASKATVLGLTAAGAAGLAMGVKVASGNEQAQIAFTTMLGSGQKAAKFLQDLQKFAAQTPFEFPELQTAASSLISAGINANKVIPIMRTLGDVTSGMGTGSEGVKRATVALQQMNAAGKITGQDLNQLRDAGIPVYDLLAKATGKSKEKIAQLANSGKLGKKELQQMMDALSGPAAQAGLGRFAGMMDKQSHSLAGMWSTIKDTAGQGLATAIAPAFPLIKQGMGGVSGALGGLSKWVTKNKASLGEFFSVVGSSLKTFGDLSAAWLKPFMSSLTHGQNTFKAFADFLGTHQEDITRGLIVGAKVAIGLAEALGVMASSGLRAFAFLMDGQAAMTSELLAGFKLILHGSALAFGWIPGIGDKLKGADAKFNGFATAAVTGMHKAADGARGMADAIDHKMTPALAAARAGLDKVAKTEIDKARNRDAALRLAHAIGGIGTMTDGTSLKIHKWSYVQRLSNDEQKALFGRLKDATRAMDDQQKAMKDAGASQADLSRAWETGRHRLYKEFLQMGLSKDEAKRLADRYAGIKPKVQTNFTQPGMGDAKDNADALKRKYGQIPKSVTTKINWDTAVDGFNTKMYAAHGKMALQMSAFHDGGYTGAKDPLAVAGVVHGDEQVTRSWARRRLEAARPGGLDYMNRTGQWPGFYGGGRVPSSPLFAALMNGGTQAVVDQGSKAIGSALRRLASTGGVGGPIGGIDVSHPRALTSYHGHTFTNLFAANLRRAEHAAGRQFVIYQGGFRPSTSYSGSTHNMDAIDAQVDYKLLRAYRRYVGAIGDRTGLGNWMSHMHGVPAPGHGYGSPSARAQYRDYLARGGASQSPKSPWGLASGGLLTARVAEHGPERLLNAPVTRRFDDMVRVLQRSGGVVIHNHYTVNAPNYVGAQNDLVKAMVVLEKQNRLPGSRR